MEIIAIHSLTAYPVTKYSIEMAVVSIDDTAHRVTMICTFVLFIKFTITVLVQGGKRFAGGSRPPEDEKVNIAESGTCYAY